MDDGVEEELAGVKSRAARASVPGTSGKEQKQPKEQVLAPAVRGANRRNRAGYCGSDLVFDSGTGLPADYVGGCIAGRAFAASGKSSGLDRSKDSASGFVEQEVVAASFAGCKSGGGVSVGRRLFRGCIRSFADGVGMNAAECIRPLSKLFDRTEVKPSRIPRFQSPFLRWFSFRNAMYSAAGLHCR